MKAGVDDPLHIIRYVLVLNVKMFACNVGEDTEIYFTLFSAKEGKAIRCVYAFYQVVVSLFFLLLFLIIADNFHIFLFSMLFIGILFFCIHVNSLFNLQQNIMKHQLNMQLYLNVFHYT